MALLHVASSPTSCRRSFCRSPTAGAPPPSEPAPTPVIVPPLVSEMEEIDEQSQNQPLIIAEIEKNRQICLNEVQGCEDDILYAGMKFSSAEIDEVCQNEVDGDEVWIPYVGVKFSSAQEAYDFYNIYAKRTRFFIRKSDVTRLKNGEVSSRLYVCNKEDFKTLTDNRQVEKQIKRRRNDRQGCHARMKIHNNNGV